MSSLPGVVYYFAKERSLLPVSIDKTGLVKWRELQERRMTLKELEAYYEAPAWAHITGKISGIFTIDVDPSGLEWAKDRELEPLAHRKTPSGGLHIDVELPTGWEVKNTVSAIAKGIDTRGEGGIALIAGRSRKGAYTWLRRWDTSPIKFAELPNLVQWALYGEAKREQRTVAVDFTLPPASSEEVESLLLRALSRSPLEGRNPMGFWLACRLRDARIDKESARMVGYQYVDRVWSTNTHGVHEAYTRRMFDAALDNAYSAVGR